VDPVVWFQIQVILSEKSVGDIFNETTSQERRAEKAKLVNFIKLILVIFSNNI